MSWLKSNQLDCRPCRLPIMAHAMGNRACWQFWTDNFPNFRPRPFQFLSHPSTQVLGTPLNDSAALSGQNWSNERIEPLTSRFLLCSNINRIMGLAYTVEVISRLNYQFSGFLCWSKCPTHFGEMNENVIYARKVYNLWPSSNVDRKFQYFDIKFDLGSYQDKLPKMQKCWKSWRFKDGVISFFLSQIPTYAYGN